MTTHDDQQAPQEGAEPMTAQTTTPPEESPFPRDQSTGMPVPPAPTREEEAERMARAAERNRRAEEVATAQAEKKHRDAIEGAREALSRLIALSESDTRAAEEAARAGLPAPQRAKGILGVEYEYPDLTEDRIRGARAAWNADLEVVRDDENEGVSLTSWRIEDIEDPAARTIIDRYIKQLPGGKKRTCILHGSVGAGKTATALAAGHAAVERGILTRYVSHNDYLARLRPGAARGELTSEQYKEKLKTCTLLVLDDFCADMSVDVAASEFARRETMELLNYRLHKGKPTIVTTNLSTAQVAKVIDDRLASRLGMNAVVVAMIEKDRREPETW